MEKIKLNNGITFNIIPMGIGVNNFRRNISFSFISDLGYGEIEATFNAENIEKIEYLSASSELFKAYNNCISLKMLSKEFNKQYEDGKFSDVYIVELETN